MRIAVINVVIDLHSRAKTIARVLNLIDIAADVSPPPALIVVPDGCDRVYDRDRVLTVAMMEMYHGVIAGKAREWGVLIGCGHLWFVDGQPRRVATVFDADGDERSLLPEGNAPTAALDTFMASMHIAVESEDLADGMRRSPWPVSELMIVLSDPIGNSLDAEANEARCREIGERCGAMTVLVRASMSESTPAEHCVTCFPQVPNRERVDCSDGGIVVMDLLDGERRANEEHLKRNADLRSGSR
jgi:hypothetical protein